MSSDLFMFDGSFYHHSSSSPEAVVSSEAELFFNDNEFFSPFSDSAIDILQALSDIDPTQQQNQQIDQNPLLLDQHQHQHQQQQEQTQISFSPPSQHLQSLSLYNHPNFGNGFANLDGFEVKTEKCCQVGSSNFENINCYYNNNYSSSPIFGPHSYTAGGVENVAKFMQRSSSSSGFLFDASNLMESPSLHNQAASFSSPENNNAFLAGHMRRVYSTGDLQNFGTTRTTQRSFSRPLANTAENSFMEEGNIKVGKYSAEERKERISKYRAKRTLRNFNKTIKYACRKTLADNRPRIRGRFARNDEPETPKAASSTRYEDEDDLWLEGLHEEEEDNETVMREQFVNSYGPTELQYYGF